MDFDQLYKTYYVKIYSFVLTIVKDRSLAEEITQEAFFKAFKSKEKYEGRSSEYTWLCAIAKNVCADEKRRDNKNREVIGALSDNVIQLKEKNDEEQMIKIHQILHGLEEPYKEVFQLRIFGELTFKQIAKIFGKTESWARVTYHRARIKMQERM
ncbi:MAG: sigma-70 family RNA polymerase sigma factor [Lachnospiraceae bacterium]|nr:sigma-70 family RNA polymerase sigma factor [Lachnospiraceae bacterium]